MLVSGLHTMAMPATLEGRVARLEANVEYIQRCVSDIKIDIRRLGDKIYSVEQRLSAKIDDINQRLSAKIESLND